MAPKRISKKPPRKNSWLSRLLKRRTETVTPSAAHRDQSTHALFKKGEVVDLDFTNYNDFIRDPEKDVIVEFYDDRNPDCNTVHNICKALSQGYLDERLAIARYKLNNADSLPTNIYCVPTIKLYPAKDKTLPVEFFPGDYADVDGYKSFIEEDGHYGKHLVWGHPIAPESTTSVA